MKMRKRLAVLMAAILCMGVLGACGQEKAAGSETSTSEAGTDTVESGEPEATPAGDGEAVTVMWQQIGTPPPNLAEVVEEMNAYSREKIGVEVDLRFFDWGEYETGINNMLNTGEDYDIAFVNTTIFTGHARQGKFLDLTDRLEDTPGLTDLIPEEVWRGVTVKGEIAGVPTYKDTAATQYVAFDKAMVDKYDIDLDAIKTLQDLDPVVRQIKEGEEAESGATFYPLPLNTDGIAPFLTLYDSFVRYDDQDAQAANIYERPDLKEDFALVHKWWEDGLINPDASTKDDAGKYRACFVYQGFEGSEQILSVDRGYEIVHTPITEAIFSSETVQGSVNAINASSQHPAEALKYLELVNTDNYLRNMYAYGMPGVDFEENDDGTVTRLTDTWSAATYSQASWFDMSPVTPNPPDQYSKVEEANKNAKAHVLLGFTLDDEPIASQWVNTNAVIDKYKAELRTGAYQGTTEEFLAKMNSELEAAGLQEVLEEIQKQVDEFLEK